jgi:antitoxin ParD1/3/4
MAITLKPEQAAQLQALVARGEYATIEEAARQLIDERLRERLIEENDDLSWAKPYVDEARASLARGEGMTLEEHKKRMAARLAALKKHER